MDVLICLFLIAHCLSLVLLDTISIFTGRYFTVLPFPHPNISYPVTLQLKNRGKTSTSVTITDSNEASSEVNISSLSTAYANFTINARWPFHIESSENISVISKIHPDEDYGIIQLLPDRFLGTEYVAMTTCGFRNPYSKCSIVVGTSRQTNVSVFITLPRARNFSTIQCEVKYKGETYSNEECIHANVSYFEYAHIESDCDLTGTEIVGSDVISVLSGSYSVTDHGMSFEQMIPRTLWRSEFLAHNSYKDRSLVVVSNEENTSIRILEQGQFITHRFAGALYFTINPNETIYIIASKSVSVFLSSATSLITVTPFGYYGTFDLQNDSFGLDIVLIEPLHSLASGNPLSYRGCTSPSTWRNKHSPLQEMFGGYYAGDEQGGTMLDAMIEETSDLGVNRTSESNILLASLNADNGDEAVDAYGKFFVLSLFPLKYVSIDVEQEVTLDVTLRNELSAVITIKDPLMRYEVDTNCSSIDIATNQRNVTVTSTTDILIYARIRFASVLTNTSVSFLLLPVSSFGYEYRTLSPRWNKEQTLFQECHVTAVEDSTELHIQGFSNLVLQQYESHVIENPSQVDSSGFLITASKPIGVMCGGYTNLTNLTGTVMMSVSLVQLPSVNTWGNLFKVKLPYSINNFEPMCMKILTSEMYSSLQFEEHVPSEGEKISFQLDSGKERVILICDRFPLHDNSSLSIQSSHPVLVALILVPRENSGTDMILLSPHSQRLDTVLRDFESCSFDTGITDKVVFLNPSVTLGGNKIASVASKLSTVYKPFMQSDQIPGDGKDNDGDGLVDEDFCQFLISDSGELLDLDFDGRINEDCIGCTAGYELNSTLGCSECKIGFYRYEVGIDVCVHCENLTTLYEGTMEEGQCVVNCFEGEEFDNQTQTCRPCPIGFYKNTSSVNVTSSFEERWYCRQCPTDLTTVYNGSRNFDECIENCAAGYHLNFTSMKCVSCGYNQYKSNTSAGGENLTIHERWNCADCPHGTVTMTINATYCVAECLEGEEFNTTLEECEACDSGYYKNFTGNFLPCEPCPQNTTTANVGSTDIEDCKAGCWCPCNMVSPVINYTEEELKSKLAELKKKLTLDKRKLTSFTKRKISAPDDRPLSKAVGSLGAIIIAGAVIVLLLFDIAILKEHFKIYLENLKFFHDRMKKLMERRVVNQSPA